MLALDFPLIFIVEGWVQSPEAPGFWRFFSVLRLSQ